MKVILKRPSFSLIFISLLGLFLFAPIAAIFYQAAQADSDLLYQLSNNVLPTYILNTVLLVILTATFSLILALPSAWLIAYYQFPLRNFFKWALVLPLSMPGYIVGYIYTDWFDYAGPIQKLIRQITDQTTSDYYFFEIRSLVGCSFILALVLFPYIYLLTREALLQQSQNLIQSAKLLKKSTSSTLFFIILPLARPSIIIGSALVMMETLGDFATVQYFALPTLTTAVFDMWQNYSDLNASSQLASLMMIGLFFFIYIERLSRRRQKQYQNQSNNQLEKAHLLKGSQQYLAFAWCFILLSAGFLLPFIQLISYAIRYFFQSNWQLLLVSGSNSLKVSILASSLTCITALFICFWSRVKPNYITNTCKYIAGFGYALPGTVLAIGILIFILGFEHAFNDLLKKIKIQPIGLFISGSFIVICIAFTIRFMTIALGSIDARYTQISPSIDQAAKTMKASLAKIFLLIHLPLLKKSLIFAFLLIFLESMKELNAAILLQPFNFNTLAIEIYSYASDEQLEIASMPAILLVIIGMIPLWLTNLVSNKNINP